MNFAKFLNFYRTPKFSTASTVDILFIGMWNIWKVSLVVTVHSFLLKLFSTDFSIFSFDGF